jgi:hypothetical protein
VKQFQAEYKEFHQNIGGVMVVSKAVNKWLGRAKSQGYCEPRTAIGRLMELIVEKTLVVDVEEMVKMHQRLQQQTSPPVPTTTTPREQTAPVKTFSSRLRSVGTMLAGYKKSSRTSSQVQSQITQEGVGTQYSLSVARYRATAARAEKELGGVIQELT